MDSNGNLLVNGNPFLLIQGENLEYTWWEEAGYTLAQADTKLNQVQAAGLNTLLGNWIGVPQYNIADQAQTVWTAHHFYWSGSATLDLSLGQDAQAQNVYGTAAGNAIIAQIVNRYKNRPYLLRWWIANEFDTDEATPQTYLNYASAASLIHSLSPAVVGDTHVTTSTSNWTQAVGPTLSQVPFGEVVLGTYDSSGEAIAHLYNDALLPQDQAWSSGQRFVRGVSTTPLPELDPHAVGNPIGRIPTQSEVDRFFLLQVAMNVRAFSILWAPNQRDPSLAPNTGDAGLPPGYLDTWNWTVQALQMITALQSVILAPAPFTVLTASPAFTGPLGGPYTGIYASMKTVGGITYVIAVNMNMTGNYGDISVQNATIDVGFPIQSVTRKFATGSVSFSGRTITDSFAPMTAHVYMVTSH